MEQATPRILIVDDSRIVRASLIKHIRGRFQFREAADGEAAWETIVLDPTIQVVISDLSMPKLDGYGLLERVRGSRVARVQTLPFIVLSGTDDITERDRAIERGATDLISKSIGASELISRLAIMFRLSDTQRQLEQSQEQLAQSAMVDPKTGLATPQLLLMDADKMLAYAKRHTADLSIIVLHVDKGAPDEELSALLTPPIAALLKQAVRKEDSVAVTGDLEFAIAAQAIAQEAALSFATRLVTAISQARVVHHGAPYSITASLGVSSLGTDKVDSVQELLTIATRRAERAQRLGGNRVLGLEHDLTTTAEMTMPLIDLETALKMLANGQMDALRPHLPRLKEQLGPLMALFKPDGKGDEVFVQNPASAPLH